MDVVLALALVTRVSVETRALINFSLSWARGERPQIVAFVEQSPKPTGVAAPISSQDLENLYCCLQVGFERLYQETAARKNPYGLDNLNLKCLL